MTQKMINVRMAFANVEFLMVVSIIGISLGLALWIYRILRTSEFDIVSSIILSLFGALGIIAVIIFTTLWLVSLFDKSNKP